MPLPATSRYPPRVLKGTVTRPLVAPCRVRAARRSTPAPSTPWPSTHTARAMPKASTLDVEAGRYPDSSSSGGGSVLALAVVALVGVAGTAGALYYVEAQLSALQVSFDKQRQQTDDAFAKHVTALQELHRAQTASKAVQPAAPKASADEEGEDKKKRRRKEAKEAKARARAKAKDEDEDEEKDESTGKGKKDEEGEDEQKDEVRPQHWAGVAVSPDPLLGGPFMVRALWPCP